MSDALTTYADGAAWAHGPQAVYDRLASIALDTLDTDLADMRVLDAGAGTGAMTLQLLARGAKVEATDLSASMLDELRRQTGGIVPTRMADIRQLPFGKASFDAAVAGCVINHLDDPASAVAEMARVTRTGGAVMTTTFGPDEQPVKAAIEDVLRAHGWTPPAWYAELKATVMPLTATPDALAAVGRAAGLGQVFVDAIDVDLGDLSPTAVVAYRLGMAHAAPFIAELDAAERATLTAEAADVAATSPPLHLPLLVLRGSSGG
jgi:SAM-dependent methyltransferase